MAAIAAPLIGAGIQGVTSLVGSGKQADATRKAAEMESATAANSLAFNRDVYGTTLANEAPYLATGNTATNALNAGIANGSLTKGFDQPFSFTGVNLQNDPAYQFDLDQGKQAMQRSAAAAGGLVSGGALKDLNNYAQGYASNQFQNSYQNALTNYQTAFNVFNSNQGNAFSRLASVAGLGQNAATQTATSGNSAASTGGQIAAQGSAQAANYLTQGAVAQGAGLAGFGNAIAGGVNTIANNLALSSGSSYRNNNGIRDANGNYLGE